MDVLDREARRLVQSGKVRRIFQRGDRHFVCDRQDQHLWVTGDIWGVEIEGGEPPKYYLVGVGCPCPEYDIKGDCVHWRAARLHSGLGTVRELC